MTFDGGNQVTEDIRTDFTFKKFTNKTDKNIALSKIFRYIIRHENHKTRFTSHSVFN